MAVALLDSGFPEWGSTVGTAKPKLLVVGKDDYAQALSLNITLHGDRLEAMSKFKYLGSIWTLKAATQLPVLLVRGTSAILEMG